MSDGAGERPRIDLTRVGEWIDRALETPAARLAESMAPRTVGAVRAARADLVELAGDLEAKALGAVGRELDEQLSRLLGGIVTRRRRRAGK